MVLEAYCKGREGSLRPMGSVSTRAFIWGVMRTSPMGRIWPKCVCALTLISSVGLFLPFTAGCYTWSICSWQVWHGFAVGNSANLLLLPLNGPTKQKKQWGLPCTMLPDIANEKPGKDAQWCQNYSFDFENCLGRLKLATYLRRQHSVTSSKASFLW